MTKKKRKRSVRGGRYTKNGNKKTNKCLNGCVSFYKKQLKCTRGRWNYAKKAKKNNIWKRLSNYSRVYINLKARKLSPVGGIIPGEKKHKFISTFNPFCYQNNNFTIYLVVWGNVGYTEWYFVEIFWICF